MRKIILDTNFLLIPVKFGVDVYSELERLVPQKHELVTLPCVLSELGNLARKNRKLKLALSIMGSKGVRVEKGAAVAEAVACAKRALGERRLALARKGLKKAGGAGPARFKKGGVLKGSDLCDQAVLSFAVAHNAVVCTLDRKLKIQARSNGLVVVHLVGKSHLGFFGAMED